MNRTSESHSQIEKRIIDYIAKEILQDATRMIDSEEALISSGLIDSFHLVDLALFVEGAFDVCIADTELSASVFDSVHALTDLIVKRMQSDSA